ncbi:MAG TPA: winged helix-turn-helix domain-containing protein [Steroidobacteraceae bacterium]|nr:winged helix-turn-helix domain-containing protein [Steroidobacteraceae bacterium]
MRYRFGDFELDLDQVELRLGGNDGERVPLEPQVFALLVLLVDARDRLVTKDEIFEKVWDGRIVTDSALASRVKSLRQALGDDGRAQRYVRTIHGRGFRFVAEARLVTATTANDAEISIDASKSATPAVATTVTLAAPPSSPVHGDAAENALDAATRPSIAVLPFRVTGAARPDAYATTLAEAIPHELIVDLSRLRWLFVTARGSSFRFREPDVDPRDVGRLLGVRYCLTGSLASSKRRALAVAVELVDTRDGGLVWAERYEAADDDVHHLRTEIRSQILAALELRIPLHEATLARLGATESLDAWSAFHVGLQHVYRFNRADRAVAQSLFEHAVTRDPRFARAHAGLSFVHFQSAFLRQTDDVGGAAAVARQYAERALELDPLDPFVNFTMGRSFWLTGELDTALAWLERSTALSPSYAQGVYARAWTESLAGQGHAGREHVDLAIRLSPLDPLHYAMLGTRALSHLTLGEHVAAAQWADRAARSPGAHVLIAMIAAVTHSLAGDDARAAAWAANVRERSPVLRHDDFLRAFPVQPAGTRGQVLQALVKLGF